MTDHNIPTDDPEIDWLEPAPTFDPDEADEADDQALYLDFLMEGW